MGITIRLDDDLVAGLAAMATEQGLSVEQYAIGILIAATQDSEPITPQQAVAKIRATAPNPSQIRSATANLTDLLSSAPAEPILDLESWRRQWSGVEAELKATTRGNDVAEGRGV